ncbi:MAG: four helix bundle protein [Oscillospiraceae bacterium]|nr:four helix bundle protein [Oscillospiraceae bacterium]MBQ1649026.1 four helix bundle protein [Bacteroidales bacterium]
MADNQLVSLSKSFAVTIINITEELWDRRKATGIINQLLRSGTGIGANIHEGNYAASRADFINKFQIALKECYETEYWLEIMHEAAVLTDEEFQNLNVRCSKIRRMLIASVNTARNRAD